MGELTAGSGRDERFCKAGTRERATGKSCAAQDWCSEQLRHPNRFNRSLRIALAQAKKSSNNAVWTLF